MFTSESFSFVESVPIIIAFYIAVTILAVNIVGRKRKWYELIVLAMVLSGFIILISFNITEIILNPKHIYGIKYSFFLSRHKDPLTYGLVLLFNVFFYTLSSFYSVFVHETTLKILMIKNTVLFIPLNFLFFFLFISNTVQKTYFDPLYFAEIYIGTGIGFISAKKIKTILYKRDSYDKG
jgi:hypothetical protein